MCILILILILKFTDSILYIHKYTSVQFWLYTSKNQVVIPIYSKLREYLRDFMIPNYANSLRHPLDL